MATPSRRQTKERAVTHTEAALERRRRRLEQLALQPLAQHAAWRWDGPWWDIWGNSQYLVRRALGLAALVLLGERREHISLADAFGEMRNGDVLLFSAPSKMTFFTMSTVTHVGMVIMVPVEDPTTGMTVLRPHVWEASTPHDGMLDVITGEIGRSGPRMVALEEKLEVYQSLWGVDFPQWRPLMVHRRKASPPWQRADWALAPWGGLGRQWFEEQTREFHFEPGWIEMVSSASKDRHAGLVGWLARRRDDPRGLFCTQLVARTQRALGTLAEDAREDDEFSLSDFSTPFRMQSTLKPQYNWARSYHII